MMVTQDQFELIDEALTDLGNKYNSTLINRQIGRILYTLDMRVQTNPYGTQTTVEEEQYSCYTI